MSLPGDVDVFDNWPWGSLDEHIDTAELIHDIPFAPLGAVLEYKLARNKPKDAKHIALLCAALATDSPEAS